jgi:hypothetical protein
VTSAFGGKCHRNLGRCAEQQVKLVALPRNQLPADLPCGPVARSSIMASAAAA